jgi:hypothetical protein
VVLINGGRDEILLDIRGKCTKKRPKIERVQPIDGQDFINNCKGFVGRLNGIWGDNWDMVNKSQA